MTLQTPSVQTACVTSNSAPTLPFIAPLVTLVEQGFSLIRKYCLDRTLTEILVEGVVATTIATVIYFGHALLVGMAAVWCLAMFSIAGYRLLALRTQDADELNAEMPDALQDNMEATDGDLTELSGALT